MKKHLLLLSLCLISFKSFSQNVFQKGYIVFNDDTKLECLIERVVYLNTPSELFYKLTPDSKVKREGTASVKEFGIYEVSKFIRFQGNVDRTSLEADKLPYKRSPKFREEILFLSVLVEGKANLYEYIDNRLKKYFFNVDNQKIEQLIKINYISQPSNNIFENNYYKQQLINNLKCKSSSLKTVKWLKYYKTELIDFFLAYNNCISPSAVSLEKNKSFSKTKIFYKNRVRDYINLTPNIGYSISKLHLESPRTIRELDLGYSSSVRFGLELEAIIPYFREKLSIVIEPSIHSYDFDEIYRPAEILEYHTKGTYKTTDLALGIRYRHILENKSTIYSTVSYATSLKIENEYFDYGTAQHAFEEDLTYISFGIGFRWKNKISIEGKISSSRDILRPRTIPIWKSTYNNYAFVLGYTIF